MDQIIICEAENIHGITRDSLQLKKRGEQIGADEEIYWYIYSFVVVTLTTRNLIYKMQELLVTTPNNVLPAAVFITNQSSGCYRILPLLLIICLLIILSRSVY